LHFDTAIALVIERELLDVELAGPTWQARRRWLDTSASSASISKPLDAAASSYLTMLACRNLRARAPAPASRGHTTCLVPGRIWARLARQKGSRVRLRDGDLENAIAWERAAIVRGLTMTEWALRVLLESRDV
jgi:hypothetical protein